MKRHGLRKRRRLLGNNKKIKETKARFWIQIISRLKSALLDCIPRNEVSVVFESH